MESKGRLRNSGLAQGRFAGALQVKTPSKPAPRVHGVVWREKLVGRAWGSFWESGREKRTM